MGIVIPMDVLQNKINKQAEKNNQITLPQKKQDICKNNETDGYNELLNRSRQCKEELDNKYKDIIKNAPRGCVRGMSYYLSQMATFIPTIFHAQNHDEEWDAYIDFSYFQTDYFYLAYSNFYKKHKKDLDNEHAFHKPKLPKKALEEETETCIAEIHTLLKSAHKNAAQIIAKVARLHELTWAIDDIFFHKLGIYD